ncbi:glycoside hydrolase family 16 protein [Mucilaginibacter defluvii]|uniref:GH16 domain-containing protein n=1 Tax=Mucilaginibacter defluvii TaxID=1196019 RepID=A0ABP9G4I3_9SPHI
MQTINYQKLKLMAVVAMAVATLSSCRKDVANHQVTDEAGSRERQTKTAANGGYEIIWADDFENGLDSTKWTISTGSPAIRHELQAYAKSNVRVSNGFLVLTAEKKATDGQQYMSGKISTSNKFTTRYGRIEARLKVPNALGLAAEFSMFGQTPDGTGIPESGEIDIMQHINRERQVLGGIQWANEGHAIYRGNSPDGYYFDYHIYAVEWDPQEIRWYIDGKQYFKANIADGINGTDEFHKPFFINFNLAVGGDLAGMTIDRNLPTSMVIDYVKVFRLIAPDSRNHITA